MTDSPISFRVCDFSEQIAKDCLSGLIYSAVMHVDGEVYQYRYAIPPEFSPPLSMLRSRAWLNLLEQISEGRK